MQRAFTNQKTSIDPNETVPTATNKGVMYYIKEAAQSRWNQYGLMTIIGLAGIHYKLNQVLFVVCF